MELGQWIAVYGAVSQSASSRERSLWTLFAGGFVSSSLVMAIIAYAVTRGPSSALQQAFTVGAAVFGLLVSFVWMVAQIRLLFEYQHWYRLLRSVESQFAGAEFHRSLHRLLQGDQVCIPSASWICDEWHPEPARFPWIVRVMPKLVALWIPAAFLLAFVALLVGISIS
jgi:hypothetical protein